jgi:hypothetical protein
MASRSAIHGQIIAGSDLSCAIMRAFFGLPYRRRFISSSDRPAWRNSLPIHRSAFCASDSFNSSPQWCRHCYCPRLEAFAASRELRHNQQQTSIVISDPNGA